MAANEDGSERANELERVKGIEPSPPAWKAGALPLSYTRSARTGDRREADAVEDRVVTRANAAGPTAPWKTWWAEQDSNLRRLSRQIYSLVQLAALVSARRSRARDPFRSGE